MSRLTLREWEVCCLVHHPNKQIARFLRITEGTVKVHLHNIFTKLRVPNRTALAFMIARLA
jgi:two-component system nitrate/nitrite response regulator NarL